MCHRKLLMGFSLKTVLHLTHCRCSQWVGFDLTGTHPRGLNLTKESHTPKPLLQSPGKIFLAFCSVFRIYCLDTWSLSPCTSGFYVELRIPTQVLTQTFRVLSFTEPSVPLQFQSIWIHRHELIPNTALFFEKPFIQLCSGGSIGVDGSLGQKGVENLPLRRLQIIGRQVENMSL